MLWMYWPNVDENCFTVDGGIGAPPDQILPSDFSASGSAFGAFISAMNTVIEPTVNVGRCSLMTSMPSVGSNRWNSTSGAPEAQRRGDVRDQPGDVEERRHAEDHVVPRQSAPRRGRPGC